MTVLLTFECYHCGLIYKAKIKENNITFSCMDKLYSTDDMLTSKGYFLCFECKNTTRINFKIFI